MPKVHILKQFDVTTTNKSNEEELLKNPAGEQVVRFDVILEADDGYQESQTYQCSEEELKDAVAHFNNSHMESLLGSLQAVAPVAQPESVEEPRVLTVKASKEAASNFKVVKKLVVEIEKAEAEEKRLADEQAAQEEVSEGTEAE